MKNNENCDLKYLNALNRISFLGPKRIAALLDYYGSAEAAWESSPENCRFIYGLNGYADRLKQERDGIDPEKEWNRLQKGKIGCISIDSAQYPHLLKQIFQPPPILYYRGDLSKVDKPAAAVVGSRRSTFYGKEVAERLGGELAASGVSVISGMALGVDTSAHRGSLERKGYTVAVLGCGIDRCYPSANKNLMEQIAADGAVFSEFPLGAKPLSHHFPQRNRIISGLSLGTVVVEATAKSGSLITANYALEQNREVFAVPGNIGSPYSRGCHQLIKEGAHLVESAADILGEIYIDGPSEEQLTLDMITDSAVLSAEERALLQFIPYQPTHVDDIIRTSGNSAARVITELLSLEIKKQIRQSPGKYFCRI